MNATMPIHTFAESLEHAVESSSSPRYSEYAQRVFAYYARALLDCYAIDDKKAVLVK